MRLNVKDRGLLSIVRIRIEGKLTLKIGEIAQLKAIAEMSDNTEVDVTAKVKWATSNSSCCVINLLGVITALVPGECLLTGVVDGVTTSVPVKVTLL